jgi:hypothetical protein
MTTESLEYLFEKFLVLNGCDANAILCDKSDAVTKEVKDFCWNHNLNIFECISSYHDFPISIGQPKFILI